MPLRRAAGSTLQLSTRRQLDDDKTSHEGMPMPMTSLLKIFTVLLAGCVIAGCKIVVTSPPSGQVRTESGAIFCNSGGVCEITVDDLNFKESFYALPNPGFEFVGWKKKHRGLCGGSSNACRLSTAGFAGTALERFLSDHSEIFYLEPVFRPAPKNFSDAYIIPDPGALWVAGENMGSHVAFTADLTLNGHQDIVVHWSTNNAGVLNAGDLERTPDSLAVFLADGNRGYEFGNLALFGDNYAPLGGASRDHSIADINGDGYPDIAFAMNLEDGRPIDPSLNLDLNVAWGAETAVMMSNGDGTYRIDILPPAAYHHAIGTIPNSEGTFDVLTPSTEYGNVDATGYRYEKNGWRMLENTFPYLQNQDFDWIRIDTDKGGNNNYLFSANYTAPDAVTPTFDLYKEDPNGWRLIDQILFDDHYPPPALTVDSRFEHIFANPDSRVIKYEGYNIAEFVIWEVEKIRLSPDGNFALLALITGIFLPADYLNRVVRDDELVNQSLWVAFEIVDDSLVPLENFMVDQPGVYQGFFYDVMDVNDDGYEDFVSYSYDHRPPPSPTYATSPERVFVYLNNQNKSLVRTALPGLPWVNTNCGIDCGTKPQPTNAMAGAKAIYTDLDNDGVRDILFRGQGWQLEDRFGRLVRSQMPTIHWGERQPFTNIDVRTLQPDKRPPELISVKAGMNAEDNDSRHPVIVLTFDETVIRNAGRIYLRDAAGDVLNIFLAESEPKFVPDQPTHTMLQLENELVLSYTGETVFSDPDEIMIPGHIYSLYFESGTLLDLAGNPLQAFQVDFEFMGSMVDYRTGQRLP
jgi:hypothetical protein